MKKVTINSQKFSFSDNTLSIPLTELSKEIKVVDAYLKLKIAQTSSLPTRFDIDFKPNESDGWEIDAIENSNGIGELTLNLSDEVQHCLDNEYEHLCLLFKTLTEENFQLEGSTFDISYLSLPEFQCNGISHDIDLGKSGSASIDLASQQISLVVPLVSSDNNVLPLSISAYYNSVKNDFLPNTGLPKNWGLNIQQFLKKESSIDRLKFTYIDGTGKNQIIEEKYYYKDENGNHFVNYADLNVDIDGNLMFNDKKIYTQLEAPSGLKLSASIKEIEGSKNVDYEPEDLINVRKNIKQIEHYIKDCKDAIELNKKQICISLLSKDTLNLQLAEQLKQYYATQNSIDLQDKIEYIRSENNRKNRSFKDSKGSEKSYVRNYLSDNKFSNVILEAIRDFYEKNKSITNTSNNETLTSEDMNALSNILTNESSSIYTLGLGLDGKSGSLGVQKSNQKLTENIYIAEFKETTFKDELKTEYRNFVKQEFPEDVSNDKYETFVEEKLQKIMPSNEEIETIYNSFATPSIVTLSSKDLLSIDLQIYNLIKNNISTEEKVNEYNEQLKKLKHQQELLELQVPVHYLYNSNNVIYGFGKVDINNDNDFRLIMIADPYENTIFIKYKEFGSNLIESITDSANKTITFNYNSSNNILESIADSRDRVVKFSLPNDKLFQITHTDGSKSNYFLSNESPKIILDQSGFGTILEKSTTESGSGNFVDLNIEKFSIVAEIKKGKISYQDSLSFNNFGDKDVVLSKRKSLGKVTNIRKNNVKSTSITTGNKSTTYLFDNLGKVRTIYENDFKQNSDENCTRVTEFSCQDNKKFSKITQLLYTENLLSDVCFNKSRIIKHSLYLGSSYCGLDSIPYSYELCDKYHTIEADAQNKSKTIFMSKAMLDKLNLSSESCSHKSYILSGWAKANSSYIIEDVNAENETAPTYLKGRKFELRIEVSYTNDDTPQVESKSFDWRNTDWQFCSVPIYIDTQKEVSEIKCIIDYSNNTGKIEFTDLEFKEANFEESLFDEQNRVIEKSSAHSQWITKYEYDNDSSRVSRELLYKKLEISNTNTQPLETTYEYNKQGSLLRMTNYNGIVKENIYNKQGLVEKSVTYHKDEPSSKFYQESCLDDKGKTTKEIDELGQDGANLEYIEGTGVISTKVYADGTKISYGYSPDDKLLEISSTINGIENTNTYGYCLDTLTSLKHNDFSVEYDYNYEGKITDISIGGKNYLSKEYIDETNDSDSSNENKCEITKFSNQEKYRQTLNDDGNVVETYYTPKPTETEPNPSERLISQNIYDTMGNLVFVKEYNYNKDGSVEENISKIFIDKFGNTYKQENKQHQKSVRIENFYDEEHSNIENCTLNIGDEELFYHYDYSNEVEPKLKGILLPNEVQQIIEHDKLGRVKQIECGNINKEFSYLKSGDHSSNLISNIKFTSKASVNENITYKYDCNGNITEMRCNNELLARYEYDGLSRIIREDNKKMGKTSLYSYDGGGNITQRLVYPFTLINNLDAMECTPYIYSYPSSGWRDQLIRFNDEKFEYDEMGNPTTYRNKNLVWSHARQLNKFGNLAEYTYNANGVRTNKTIFTDNLTCNCDKTNCNCNDKFETQFFLDGNKIIKQHDCCNDLTFYYGADDITGFHLKNNIVDSDYFYKKNLQNDIIGIYDVNGKQIVRYTYDAWGNTKTEYLKQTTKENGETIEEFVVIQDDFKYNDTSDVNRFIAFKNPFRYRSYYYDFETGLYYLNSRYYDPEIGRFINADDISALETTKEVLNGLNLYAYCFNNPINTSDENGDMPKWLRWLISGIIAIIVIATVIVVSVATAGLGTAFAGALGGGVAATILGSAVGGAVTGAITGAIMSFGISVIRQGISNGYDNINWGQVGIDALIGAASGFVSGAIFGAISGTVKVLNAAKSWAPAGGKTGLKQMSEHYTRHVIKEGQQSIVKNILNYTKQANQFFAQNSSSGYLLREGVIKIAGAPGGIFNTNGLIRSFWYILKP